jgi:hypothetical protein
MKEQLSTYTYANGAEQPPPSAKSVDCLANEELAEGKKPHMGLFALDQEPENSEPRALLRLLLSGMAPSASKWS